MDVFFQSQKLARICDNESLLIRKYGPVCARLIQLRLNQLKAVENLNVVRSMPHMRCHELKGNMEGSLAVDLDHPYRLIFEPANEPMPRKNDGGLDWQRVTVIRILSVEDYHG